MEMKRETGANMYLNVGSFTVSALEIESSASLACLSVLYLLLFYKSHNNAEVYLEHSSSLLPFSCRNADEQRRELIL